MTTKIYFTAILSLGLSFFASAQFVIDMPQVDVITYNYYQIEFYKQVEEDKFLEIHLDINSDKDGILIPNVYEEKNEKRWYTLKELKDNEILFIKDLASYSEEKLIDYITKNQWLIKNKKEHIFFSAFNREVITLINTSFSKENGLTSYEYLGKEKGKKWIVNDLEWYQIVIISFGNDKHIALFNEYDNIEGAFLPLKRKNIVVFDEHEVHDDNIATILPRKIKEEKKNKRIVSARFDYDEMYRAIKNKNGKYQFLLNYGNKITENEYDTIIHNNLFYICKNEEIEKIDIYKSTLEKLTIPNLKAVYLLENGLEVLTKEGVSYYDWEGKKVDQLAYIMHYGCGTGNFLSYRLGKFITTDSLHFLSVEDFASKDKTFLFSDLPSYYQLSFIISKRYGSRYLNRHFKPNSSNFPNFLKVKNNDKYGLYKYDQNFRNEKIDTVITTQSTLTRGYNEFHCQIIPTEEILPIVYDSMVLGGKNNLIYLYKDNKIAIYPNFEKPVFDKVERKTPSFYAILRNGKKGWLDINTFKEYYFD